MYLSSSRRIFILPNFNPYFSSESHRSRLCCSAFVLAGSIPTNKYRTHDRGTLEVTKDEENPISRRGRSLFAAAFDEVHSKFERPIAFKRLIARFRAWSAARSIARIHRLAISTSGFSNEKFSSPPPYLSLFLFLSFSLFLLRARAFCVHAIRVYLLSVGRHEPRSSIRINAGSTAVFEPLSLFSLQLLPVSRCRRYCRRPDIDLWIDKSRKFALEMTVESRRVYTRADSAPRLPPRKTDIGCRPGWQ